MLGSRRTVQNTRRKKKNVSSFFSCLMFLDGFLALFLEFFLVVGVLKEKSEYLGGKHTPYTATAVNMEPATAGPFSGSFTEPVIE